MRASKEEIEKIFRKTELEHNIREGILSEIYSAEARVVFLGKRRNIINSLRKIVQNSLKNGGYSENKAADA